MRKEFRSLLEIEEARSLILSRLPLTVLETVDLASSLGRVLGERVTSGIDVPGFDRASMDGYAVRSSDVLGAREDIPVTLELIGSVPMGSAPEISVGSGQAAEVSTGSMMPLGADAVIMVEYSEIGDGDVQIFRPLHAGENVIKAGSDISLGETVLSPGIKIGPREIGVLAASGKDRVQVRRLTVAVASTGDELVEPGGTLGTGKVYDVNSYTISAAAQEAGAVPIRYSILPDKWEAMAQALQKMARNNSMILVSGSTSAGAGDMIYRVLEDLGEITFHGVNLKPGKPTIFGVLENKPFLGLPGYPTSALTVFGLLGAPAIRAALGLKSSDRRFKARLARPVRTEGRHQMLAVGLSEGLAYPVDKGSGAITTLSRADGAAEIPAGTEYLNHGDEVTVMPLGDVSVPDLVLVGEPSEILEAVLERLPFDVRYLQMGSRQGLAAIEDGIADASVVASGEEIPLPDGTILARGFRRELGLMAKSCLCMDNLSSARALTWRRESEMSRSMAVALEGRKLTSTDIAKTHSALAAAIVAGKADLGFGEGFAARTAGLCFRPLAWDEVDLVIRKAKAELPAMKALMEALRSLDNMNLPEAEPAE